MPTLRPVEPVALRTCLGRFATGVTVVTYQSNHGPRGATVNAFTSVSLDPPLVLVSISRRAKACELLINNPFCVNVLALSQADVALSFAGQSPEEQTAQWHYGERAPRLLDSHAWLECDPWRHYDGGDHVLFLGEVRDLEFRDTEPLIFHAGQFRCRGEKLDSRRRGRSAPGPACALQLEALETLQQEFIAGWL